MSSPQIKQIEGLQTALDNATGTFTGRYNSAGPIKQIVTQSATDTIDINGLDFETDGQYRIFIQSAAGSAGVTSYKIYAGDPTLDTTDANYDTSRIQAGIADAFLSVPLMAQVDAAGEAVTLDAMVSQDVNGRFKCRTSGVQDTLPISTVMSVRSVNTFNNITKIRLFTDDASGFVAGTTVQVFRLGGSLPTATSIKPLDIKRAADGFDDEFDSGSLDASWTVVSGASGTVSYTGNGSPGGGNAAYDLNTRSGWLLVQGNNTEDFEVYKARTLAAGESYVVKIAGGLSVGGSGNDGVLLGASLSDSAASHNGGNSLSFQLVQQDASTIGMAVTGGGTYSGLGTVSSNHRGAAGESAFLRIDRTTEGNYAFSYSFDGTSWFFVTETAVGTVLTNFYLFSIPLFTHTQSVPIHGFDWVRLGDGDSIDPWPLVDGSTTAPTATGEFRGALLNLATSQTGVSSPTNVSWDTSVEDTDGFYSGASPTRLTIPDGVNRVRISAGVRFDNVTGTEIRAEIFKNGARFLGGAQQEHPNSPTGVQAITLNTQAVQVSTGDYFELQTSMTGGTTYDINGSDVTWFGLEVVEPVVALTDEGAANVTNADSPYAVPNTKRVIYCDTTSGAITLNLPALAGNDGQVYEVKIIAGSNSVTVDPNASETIEGSSTYVFSGVNEARTFRAKSINGNLGWYLLNEVKSVDTTLTYTLRDETSASVTAAIGDAIRADTTSNAITINLPAITASNDGQTIRVKFVTQGSTNTVTLDANGSDTVNGAATFEMDVVGDAEVLIADFTNTNWELW